MFYFTIALICYLTISLNTTFDADDMHATYNIYKKRMQSHNTDNEINSKFI